MPRSSYGNGAVQAKFRQKSCLTPQGYSVFQVALTTSTFCRPLLCKAQIHEYFFRATPWRPPEVSVARRAVLAGPAAVGRQNTQLMLTNRSQVISSYGVRTVFGIDIRGDK